MLNLKYAFQGKYIFKIVVDAGDKIGELRNCNMSARHTKMVEQILGLRRVRTPAVFR